MRPLKYSIVFYTGFRCSEFDLDLAFDFWIVLFLGLCFAGFYKHLGLDFMATYHLRAKIIKRSHGQSVVASAAYRSGDSLYDERIGTTFDYTRKQGILHTEIMTPDNAPEWMGNNLDFSDGSFYRRLIQGRKNIADCQSVILSLVKKDNVSFARYIGVCI